MNARNMMKTGNTMNTGKMKKSAGYAQGGNVQAKQQRYAHGGIASAGSSKLMPTNQTTTKARGAGAATKGTNFKV